MYLWSSDVYPVNKVSPALPCANITLGLIAASAYPITKYFEFANAVGLEL
jgi:hypothetical protein